MDRILYHGPDRAEYNRIRRDLPENYCLCPGFDRKKLLDNVGRHQPIGLILPLHSPGPEDLNYLRRLVSIPHLPGVLVTSCSMTVQQAVCCMRIGAYDCLTGGPSGHVIASVFERMKQERLPGGSSDAMAGDPENTENLISTERPQTAVPRSIVGESPAGRSMLERLLRYGELDHPVLITGETGSGKEVAARIIHRNSSRSSGPFVAVNCATLPDDLLGTELFGSRKGAFTGSVDRPGLFECSSGGTLFLDEVGELSPRAQASLLRVLEEKAVRRLGSNHSVPVDVRVLSATNRPLRELMKENAFREDLFYRLNLLGIGIPPLRKRCGDIPLIARDFLARSGGEWKISPRAVAALVRFRWPGNIRELQSVLLKATVCARDSVIRREDLDI